MISIRSSDVFSTIFLLRMRRHARRSDVWWYFHLLMSIFILFAFENAYIPHQFGIEPERSQWSGTNELFWLKCTPPMRFKYIRQPLRSFSESSRGSDGIKISSLVRQSSYHFPALVFYLSSYENLWGIICFTLMGNIRNEFKIFLELDPESLRRECRRNLEL